MGFTILSVAYPFTAVGPDEAGGSEQILTLLDKALVEAGHRSIVIAAANSVMRGELIPSPNGPELLDEPARKLGREIHHRLIQDVLANYSVDLIHMHGLDFHCYIPKSRPPLLATLHLPPDWYPPSIFSTPLAKCHLNCVSSSQFAATPPSVNPVHMIPNGVDVERLAETGLKQDYAVALGRICPEKGFHFALDAARLAGTDLLLAGKLFPYAEHLAYFEKEITPRLDARRRFIGSVGFAEKKKLLAAAKCILIPSTVSETSSLVAMEALSSGTPVIAFPSGALPEIVDAGRTGFLVRNTTEMAAAITAAGNLSPEACREHARVHFPASTMLRRYFELYEILISNKAAAKGAMYKRSASPWLLTGNRSQQ